MEYYRKIQGGSNMTGTDLCVNKPHMSRSYLNHPVFYDRVLLHLLLFIVKNVSSVRFYVTCGLGSDNFCADFPYM